MVYRTALLIAASGLIGMTIPILLWRRFPTSRRRYQRLVDLASYFFTLLALGSGLLAVHRYEDQWREVTSRMPITEASLDFNFDAFNEFDQICPTWPRHTPFQLKREKREECRNIGAYLLTQQSPLPGSLALLGMPNWPTFKTPEVEEFAKKVRTHVWNINKATLSYVAKRPFGPNPLEANYLAIALPILAFALGLGIARRALDTLVDWKS